MMVIMAFIAGRRRHQAQSCVTLKARLKPCTAIRRGHSVGPSTAARPPSWAASVRGSGAVRDPWAEASSPGAWLTRCRQHPHPERHRRKQTLTWAHDGKLATDTTPAGTTSYVYDADGNLLQQKEPRPDHVLPLRRRRTNHPQRHHRRGHRHPVPGLARRRPGYAGGKPRHRLRPHRALPDLPGRLQRRPALLPAPGLPQCGCYLSRLSVRKSGGPERS